MPIRNHFESWLAAKAVVPSLKKTGSAMCQTSRALGTLSEAFQNISKEVWSSRPPDWLAAATPIDMLGAGIEPVFSLTYERTPLPRAPLHGGEEDAD